MTRIVFLLFLFAVVFSSCSKDEESNLPSKHVCLEIDLNSWDKELKSDYSYKMFNARTVEGRPNPACGLFGFGFGGVIVVRGGEGEFSALDLACPYEARSDVSLRVSDDKTRLVCDACKSEFELIGMAGRLVKGPAKYNMTNYFVFPVSEGKYSVINLNN